MSPKTGCKSTVQKKPPQERGGLIVCKIREIRVIRDLGGHLQLGLRLGAEQGGLHAGAQALLHEAVLQVGW